MGSAGPPRKTLSGATLQTSAPALSATRGASAAEVFSACHRQSRRNASYARGHEIWMRPSACLFGAAAASGRHDSVGGERSCARYRRLNSSAWTTFGHLAGDRVLRALATSSARVLRSGDLLARYGGEEFVAMIYSAKKEALVALAERVRVAFAEVRVDLGGSSVGVTVSVGVALSSESASANYLDLVALADERMYVAKLEGRNRVCSSAPTTKLRRPEAITPTVMDLRTLGPPASGTQTIRADVDSAKSANGEGGEMKRR